MNSEDRRIVPSSFRPARWLTNRHAQTLFPSLPWVARQKPALRREILELPDGDETAVDWLIASDDAAPGAPLLIVLLGLESTSRSSYARMLVNAAGDKGWRCCILHFRDCGDFRNRLPRRYHAGATGDVRFLLDRLATASSEAPIVAAGFSLGGNVLLKYLGEAGDESPVRAAAAACVPLDLHVSAEAIGNGFSRIYQSYLLKRMKKAVRRKFSRETAAFDWPRAMEARTFPEFDDAVTAPLHGFAGKADYYDRCSSINFLSRIRKPTLIVNALDDPFMTPDVVPGEDRLSSAVSLELSDRGGHVGFIEGGTPWRPRFYLPRRILSWLERYTVRP